MYEHRNPCRNHPAPVRRGFTLVEILVAVGVLTVLIGIILYATGALTRSAREKDTKVALGNLRGMLAELDKTTRLEGMPSTQVSAPGSMEEGQPGRTGPAVAQTRLVMNRLASLSPNRTALDNFASEKKLFSSATPPAGEAPVLLDGWNNPIIYVPGALINVTVGGQTGAVTPSRLIPGSQIQPSWSTTSSYSTGDLVIHNGTLYRVYQGSPSGLATEPGVGANWTQFWAVVTDRPFWASAGEDGDFSKGDDNLYSFDE